MWNPRQGRQDDWKEHNHDPKGLGSKASECGSQNAQ
jgi:hypothetical protein